MRVINGRPIFDGEDFASMGESFQTAMNKNADIIEEAANLLSATVDGDDLAADAGVFDGNLIVSGTALITGTATASGQLNVNGNTIQAASATMTLSSASISGQSTLQGQVNINGNSLSVGSTSGLKIGTSASQKLGLFGVTPVVQGTSCGAISIDGSSALADCNALKTGLLALNTALKNLGVVGD